VDKVPGSSGYDLTGVAARSLALIWPVSRTLVYRELERLTDLGWVQASRVEQSQAPSKWIYRTTASGRAALRRWLRQSPDVLGTTRNPVLLRIFFAHRMAPGRALTLLQQYRSALESQLEELTAIADKLQGIGTPAATAGWLTALHGTHTTRARLDWVDQAQATFRQESG
jgi:DNA-binding PadR family transcriptional regulator